MNGCYLRVDLVPTTPAGTPRIMHLWILPEDKNKEVAKMKSREANWARCTHSQSLTGQSCGAFGEHPCAEPAMNGPEIRDETGLKRHVYFVRLKQVT